MACRPNLAEFNVRLLRVAVELLGGDAGVAEANRPGVAVGLTQLGRQTLRRNVSPGNVQVVSVDAAALSLAVPDAPLLPGAPLAFGDPICAAQPSVATFISTPAACPSPFSTYSLSVGNEGNTALDAYLATVTTVR